MAGIRTAAAALLSAFTLCVGASGTAAAQPIPAPDADPFYAAPPNLGSYANGAVLGSREIAPLALDVPLPVKAWQVQYKSEDTDFAPTTGMATILVPTAPWTGAGPRPLLSYQIAEDSLATRCDPSYAIRAGVNAGLTNSSAEMVVATLGLFRNWAVVIPDYQGPRARFLDRVQAGHSVLDGVRAAVAFGPAGLSPQTPVGAAGYSGGAFATLAAAELQPVYAPDLHFAGIAAGGLPADLMAAGHRVNGGSSAGLGMLALEAFAKNHPEAGLLSLLNDRGKAAFREDAGLCGIDLVLKYANANIDEYTLAPDIFDHPIVRAVTEKEAMGQGVPRMPFYAWHSTADDALPIGGTDVLIDKYCAAGASISYHRTNVPTHLGAALPELSPAFDFVGDRFAGKPVQRGCVVR